MNAGLPTTGIGGVFYTLSVLAMLLLEIFKTITGKSSWKSWGFAISQLVLVLLMTGSIFVTGEIVLRLFPKQVAMSLTSISPNIDMANNASTLYYAPIILLALLVSSTQALRLYFYAKGKYK